MNLVQYNTFGGLIVRHDKITATIHYQQSEPNSHAQTRILSKPCDLAQIKQGEICIAEFGIYLSEDRTKDKTVLKEITKPRSKKSLLSIPEVDQILSELKSLARRGIYLKKEPA